MVVESLASFLVGGNLQWVKAPEEWWMLQQYGGGFGVESLSSGSG